MLSKNKQKLITSLEKKKYRDLHELFVAEGTKLVSDLLVNNMTCNYLTCTDAWHKEHEHLLTGVKELSISDEIQIKKVTQLKSAPPVIAIFEQKKKTNQSADLKQDLVIYLDDVQDPGNLGTIIRLADWFGIKHIFCSPGCADVYNHKTIQSTMGAIARVDIQKVNPIDFLSDAQSNNIPIYGTFLEGENIYEKSLTKNGIIMMGNEGKGIHPDHIPYVSQKLFIPSFPADSPTSESLNVSIATAIVCSEFRRR